LAGLERPGVVAERLPKALIHRNVPGEPIHRFLTDLDAHWARAAGHANFGARQRFRAMAEAMKETGWPLVDGPSRWRLGELTVAWPAVAPAASTAQLPADQVPADQVPAHHGPAYQGP
jgi:hypothetical protein